MQETLKTIDAMCVAWDDLSESEKRIASYIISSPEEAMNLSVKNIADICKTSTATVSRFARHVGFENFSSMRLAIAGELFNQKSQDSDVASSITADDISGSISYILENKIKELRATAEHLDDASVQYALELIKSADSILFAAVGNSIPVCSSFAFKLGQIGIKANCPPTTEIMMLASLSLKPEDVLCIVSSSGYSRRLETIFDNAEAAGARIILITSNPSSALAQRANLVIQTVERDKVISEFEFSSHVSASFVTELLFLLIFIPDKNAKEYARLEKKILGRDKAYAPTFS